MKLFRLKKGLPSDQIIVDGNVPEHFEQTLADFGYEEAGGIEAIIKALTPSEPVAVVVEEPKEEKAPAKKKRKGFLS